MNTKQTKLIEQAATVETDGEGWRKRMEDWLDAKYAVMWCAKWTAAVWNPNAIIKIRCS